MGNVTSQYVEAGLDRMASYWTKPKRILLLGLDGAGKTTLLYKMKLGNIEAISTISLNVETIKYEKTEFTIWDFSGRQRQRPLWGFYSKNTDAVIYVIDSADRGRIDEAVHELHRVFDEDALRDCKLLVLANKQDQPDCMSVEELHEKLALHRVIRNSTHITRTVATSGQGIDEGMMWLSRAVTNK
ncbi:hypothetical protein PHYSODRAFT_339066 [Phytophthora sojae]|uniref:Uncharacterized protein n=1 Tax=Phytophthora sojae (strain P6497) TaxID=1094619 RepID=G5A5L1_PHYSP|nr:hypothetical protein PHYSODRAFT_339066 [Phytophthora sojae]EGZ08616.1 hypothetical protein PHYSODRAFT_339066 [Phytophthora sojae]|eukprot:XP_009535249.1 hypothetical protein PHYSODRAFT_339066 [Phytophthora sojae]